MLPSVIGLAIRSNNVFSPRNLKSDHFIDASVIGSASCSYLLKHFWSVL